jgi:signal transduction histidine kinase
MAKGVSLFGKELIWLEASCLIGLCSLLATGLLWQLYRSRRFEVEFRLSAQSQRRERVARESLDTMIQRAQGFILVFQGFAGELRKTDSMRNRMELALDEADSCLNEARERTGEGRTIEPIDDVAFALSRACRRLFADGPIQFSTLSTGTPQLLVAHVADDIYRIGVEALSNALIHASPSRVEVEVGYEAGCFRLCVRDDGCGLNTRSLPRSRDGHLIGLRRIARVVHRLGGHFRIWSRRAVGTEIEVVVPATQAYCHADFVPHWIQTVLFRRWIW